MRLEAQDIARRQTDGNAYGRRGDQAFVINSDAADVSGQNVTPFAEPRWQRRRNKYASNVQQAPVPPLLSFPPPPSADIPKF